MDFLKHVETAWKLTLKNIVPLILMTLVMIITSFITLGILAPVTMAGYMQSILLMLRDNREPKIQDIFSQMNLFLPLLLFGIVVFFAIMIGFRLLVLPGIIISLIILFTCFYMLPLMTDKKLGLIEAIRESYYMSIKGQIVEHIIVVILYTGIIAIGGSVLIGSLFTQPFATIFLLSVYSEKANQQLPASDMEKPVQG
ncbi:MAG TPA: hypothetical protein ENG35_00325 [Desulfobacteraceae bacterium]|nr:hypothetical protein [Desulfobacteraceae bacterium]